MKKDTSDFWPGLFCGFCLAIFILWLARTIANDVIHDPRVNECVLGGYSLWTGEGPQEDGLCLGIIDGRWQAEPLSSVRERID